MKAYWSRCGPRDGNFGDKLTPLLLGKFGVHCDWAAPERAKFFGAGSILEKVPENFRGTIWTTGFMHQTSRKDLTRAQVIAVRGCLTRDRIEANNIERVLLGDAGLLCDVLSQPAMKRFALGIIPHFTEQDDPLLKQMQASDPENIQLIDICDEPERLLRATTECENIVSTSLHGLIIADSFGIPNRWAHLSRRGETVLGHGCKFRDYYSAFDLDAPSPIQLEQSDTASSILRRIGAWERPRIVEIKEVLRQSLRDFTSTLVSEPSAAEREAAQEDWAARLQSARETLVKLLPASAKVIVADEDQIRHTLNFARVFAFQDRDGTYWGPPSDDATAMQELERLKQFGAEYFAVVFPAFWMIESFKELSAILNSGTCVHRDSCLLLFSLKN
jgi:pyruvyltransferase